MGRPRKEEEQKELRRVVKASSERLDVVRRAKALLAGTGEATLTAAGQKAGLSREAVAQIVLRFNQCGLAVLATAAGRGRKPTYTSEQRARIVAEVQREPDRKKDQTAIWSLMLLRDALRKSDLPQIGAETIREVLHDAGYSSQRTRTWCRTGYALRKGKSGTVTVSDLETPEKKDGSNGPASKRKRTELSNSMKTKLDPLRPFPSLGLRGNQKVIPRRSPMSTSVGAPPKC
ncbi:MAG TPA: helix-turn-helix domain-containing protein [Ktedonobacteraceae bacterium]|jgi:transposase